MNDIQAASRIRVLLDVEPGMLCELLSTLLDKLPDVDIVGVARDPVDLLVAVAESDVDVVVQSWRSASEMPEVCTHLFAEYPDLKVIGIPPDASCICICRPKIKTTRLPAGSVSGVVAAIRGEMSPAANAWNGRSIGKSELIERSRPHSGV